MVLGWFNFARKTTNDLGIDLGTINTLICTSQRGLVVNEPSIVAVDKSKSPVTLLEVGDSAYAMEGRTPEHIKTIRPVKEGVIAEFEWAEAMLKRFVQKAQADRRFNFPPRMVIGIPRNASDIERRAVGEAAYSAGARLVYLVDEPLAAAIGARLPVDKPTGSLVVDVGGGTTEIAVISLNGIVTGTSIRLAGEHLTQAIRDYLRESAALNVSDRQAEEIKIRLGSALADDDDDEMEVRGTHVETGLPHSARITSAEVRDAMHPILTTIVAGIKRVLEQAPPDLSADIVDYGILLAGGGSLIPGFDELIRRELEIDVHIPANPLTCVVAGTERILTDKTFGSILEHTQFDPHLVL